MNARTIASRLRQGLAWGLVVAGGLGGLALGLGPHEGRSASIPLPPAAASAASAAWSAASHAVAPPAVSSAVVVAASHAAAGSVTGATASGVFTPVRAAASAASAVALSLPARAACVADPADPDRCGPLTLQRDPVTLPAASLGRAYAQAIRAEGGQPPYRFDLVEGSLPGGLMLDDRGQLAGTPVKSGGSRFRVRVVDAAGGAAAQTYSLRVGTSARPASSPASRAAPASAPSLGLVDVSQAGPPANAAPTARVYQLDAAQLDALKGAIVAAKPLPEPPPTETSVAPADDAASAAEPAASVPELPLDLAWSDAQQTQLEAMLKPVFAVEYPTQSLFEAAVDAQVCAQARKLIVHEAQRLKQQQPSHADFASLCSSPAEPAAAKSSAKAPSPAPSAASGATGADMAQPVSWRSLPAWLMPPGLRDWLVEAAARDRPLMPTKPPPWAATPSCNCAAPRIQQPLYAVYPAWLADGPLPQALDFSLANRVTYFGLPLGDERALDQVAAWDEARTAFIRTALAHETRIDFGVYRADWSFLATEPAAARETLLQKFTTEAPRRIRELLDTPLPGLASKAKAWLPGFGQVQRMGDGVTVFFDRLPDARREPLLAARFAEFYPSFVKGLAQALAQNPGRHYAINLVMTDRQLADKNGPFDVGRLFDLLKTVEVPDIADGRIVETNGDYKRHGNVELRFLVLLAEPTTESKKTLRATVEASPALQGGDRRIFLRSVVPLLLLPQASPEQYRDDLVYVQDNFGGLGFWPTPLIGQQFDAEQQKALRNTFDPATGTGVGDALCGIVCPNRWLFRLAFELLLLAGVVCWLLLQWNCDWRARYGRYALLGAIPPLLVGAALLQCDPALEALRKGNAQLIALIAIPLLAALWALLKRKEDKP